VTSAEPASTRRGTPDLLRGAASTFRYSSFGRLAGVLVGLIVVCGYLWATEPVFMTWANWQNVIRSEAVVAILAIGMTFVVLTGGIDLSVASMTSVAAVVLGLSIHAGWELAALAALGAGLGMGLLNGGLIGPARIPFFVVTLATLSIYQSIALVIAPGGETISLESVKVFSPVATLANGSVGPIPSVLFLIVGLYLLGSLTLRLTSFGQAVYAVGSNREAARLAGIRVTAVIVAVYAVCGLTAGIGAIVQAGRLTAAQSQADPNLMLTVVAAVLIGGTAFSGGEGNLLGTAIGVLFLGLIDNGLALRNVNAFWEGAISGSILIGAVGIGVLRQRRLRLRRPHPRQALAAFAGRARLRGRPGIGWDADGRQSTRGTAARSARPSLMGLLERSSLGRVTGPLIGLLGVCAYLWATQPVFMTWTNWQNIFRTQAPVAIIAVGMTFVVLTAGIDLSVASTAAVSGITLGLLIGHGWGWLPAVLAAIGVGTGLGLANGLMIGVLRIPFFVVTLGTLSIYQSVALLLSQTGETRSLLGFTTFDTVGKLANGNTWKLPTILVITIGIYIVASLALRYTRFGRSVYAVGSNSEAASLTGIRVRLVQVAVYTISGLFAALGTIVLAGRLTATAPQADPNLMLTVVAAVLIGGVAFTGGDGNLLGTAVGVLFLGVIQDGLTLSQVNSFWQGLVSGAILLAAVGIGVVRQHRTGIRRAARAQLRRASETLRPRAGPA
jgi:ribose transport system permease protein